MCVCVCVHLLNIGNSDITVSAVMSFAVKIPPLVAGVIPSIGCNYEVRADSGVRGKGARKNVTQAVFASRVDTQ